MKVYVTKWVGVIKEIEGEWLDSGYFHTRTGPRMWDRVAIHAKYVHLDWPSAVAAAKELRAKRVASLLKQAAKLEAIDFDKVERG